LKTRFGLTPFKLIMNKRIRLLITVVILAIGCARCSHNNQQENSLAISPDAGTTYKAGDVVSVKVHYTADIKPDSVVYLVDSVKIGSLKDSSVLSLKTDTMVMGPRLITAKIYQGGKDQDISTNIVVFPAKAPVPYTFKVIKTFAHDTSCYTEGLIYQDGYLYESGGGQSKNPPGQNVDLSIGQSSLRKVDLNTGKIVQKIMDDPTVFGEGISIVGNKIIQLTWKNPKLGYIYDKGSFKLLSTFNNNIGVEGWGLCFDGSKLYLDDSTNRIWFIDKNSWRAIGYIDVYDDKGPVDSVNELEYIDGKLYANVYQTNNIVVIDPKTGAVLEKIDMSSLYPEPRTPPAEVMNGIAYDQPGKRIFVTGKKWPHLYQVEFVKK
jgi:glutamine cyclotransferase